jgi:alpha-mannosidase
VVEAAYALNYPLLAAVAPERQGGALPLCYRFAGVDAGHVILETVKRAEDGEGWVVRVYEYKQCRSSAVQLSFAQPVRRAVECNLMEEDERPARIRGQRVVFDIAQYEIKTFKVWF